MRHMYLHKFDSLTSQIIVFMVYLTPVGLVVDIIDIKLYIIRIIWQGMKKF